MTTHQPSLPNEAIIKKEAARHQMLLAHVRNIVSRQSLNHFTINTAATNYLRAHGAVIGAPGDNPVTTRH